MICTQPCYCRIVTMASCLSVLLAGTAVAQDARQALFERVFGEAVKLDPAMVAKVKAAKPGTYLFVDRNGDGKNDEAWFIDTAARHQEKVRPVLVRAIDEDGDMDKDKAPDLDSDLYVVDWKADGTVDVVLDYQDNDGDNDVDEMAFYFYMPSHPYFGKDVLRVWWGRDDGDDNLLWYDVDYTYYQELCQYRCHFSGDESFVAFGLKADSDRWLSAYENPFLFYDPDGDGCSEVVLRIEGQANEVRAVRYSFDADDDAFGRRTHDYDFSITAVAEEGKPVQLPENTVKGITLRGIPTQAWLQREPAQAFVTQATWARAVLTWDEMNANTEENVDRDPHERWEGIIAHASKNFPQVGGPPCSVLNKRNEVSLKPASPMKLYYDPTDHRLHLKGANEGWLDVDYNFDGRVDAKYTYLDDNQDGIFDRRQLDLDADGRVDFDWKMGGGEPRELPLEFAAISSFYKSELAQVLADSQEFIDAAYAVGANAILDTIPKDATAASQPVAPSDPLSDRVMSGLMVADYFTQRLESWMPATGLGSWIRKSPAGTRFYVDLLRDRLLDALKPAFGQHAAWPQVESLYAAGNYKAAAQKVINEFLPKDRPKERMRIPLGARRIPIHVDNTNGPQRDNWPVTIAVRDLKAVANDFDPARCIVVTGRPWINWRNIVHQVDEIDSAVGAELSFLADLPAKSSETYYVYLLPEGVASPAYPRRTGTAEDWVPPNIGWESNRVAYRAYWGQFDFFGKKTDRLIYDDIGNKSYHEEVDWGIDALHVGETSGLGGLALYAGDAMHLVQDPAGKGAVKFTKRQLAKGPIRAAVEMTASTILPGKPDLAVRILCTVYADRAESQVRATVTHADEPLLLAPGLVKLPREKTFTDKSRGTLGTWGYQEAAIDEIGMAVIVPPGQLVDAVDLPAERRLRCQPTREGQLDYWIVGDWRRGRQHPIAPTIDNWQREMRELADRLHHPPKVEVGAAEKAP